MTDSQLIVAKLKTNANPAQRNVIPFGSALPSPMYVVVKLEETNLGYTRVRVIPHVAVGQISVLDEYCYKTAFDLLANQELTNAPTGRRIKLRPFGYGPVVTTNSDGTISKEALFKISAPVFR